MHEAQRPRILIVDDEPAHLRALADTLQANGYDVTARPGGEEALAALRAARFDLLLTDLHMPGLGGIGLLREALALDPALAGIVMTGGGSIESAVAAMQSGAIDYILKPFKLSTALPVLARALQVQALRQENMALQARVQTQLQELSSAYQQLEAFSMSVSHDLRAPLQVAGAFAEVLAEEHAGQLDAAGRDHLARIRGSLRHMEELICGLLRLAQVARQTLDTGAVDMTRLAQDTAEDAVAAGQLRREWLRIDPLPPARGDATLLRQVFSNLLSNAGKFSGGQAQPQVHVGADTEDGETVYFVRDNGAGFDMDFAQHLFEPFRRLHAAGEFPGLGVGLSIVHRIVQRHGGRIWATGGVGQGATFRFTLGR